MESADNPRDDIPVFLNVPLRNRVKASSILLTVFLLLLSTPLLGATRLLWVGAGLLLPLLAVQMVELVRGGSLQISTNGVRMVNALGRERMFAFSECSEFEVWTHHYSRKQIATMVVFNYSGKEKTGILTRQNKAYSGYNAYINAAFGMTADAMADLLNVWRTACLEPNDGDLPA